MWRWLSLLVVGAALLAWRFFPAQQVAADAPAPKPPATETSTITPDAVDAAFDAAVSAAQQRSEADRINALEAVLVAHAGHTRIGDVQCLLATLYNNRAGQVLNDDERFVRIALNRALVLCPSNATISNNRARLFAQLAVHNTGDNPTAAREDWRIAATTETLPSEERARYWQHLAQLERRQHDDAAALKALDAAVALHPGARLQQERDRLARDVGVEVGFAARDKQHFSVRFSGAAQEKLAYTALDALEKAYFSIGNVLDLYPREPIIVIIYTGDQYARATDAPDWSQGVFDGKIRIRQGQLMADAGTLEPLLRHEYTHAAIATLPVRVPHWLNEGLAEVMESPDVDSAKAHASRVNARLASVPLQASDITQAFAALNSDAASRAYAISTLLVVDLIERRGAFALRTLMVSLTRGETFEAAFTTTFATTPEAHVHTRLP